MYHTAKRLPDEELKEARQATAVKKPREEERAGLRKDPRSRERAEASKEPLKASVPMFSRRKWFKGAPAREHGAGSRAGSPDAFAVSPSLREGPTWRFESSIPG